MNFIELLDQAIEIAVNAGQYRNRVVKTLKDGEKILVAVEAADLGETEKAVVTRLLTLDRQLIYLVDGTVPPAVA